MSQDPRYARLRPTVYAGSLPALAEAEGRARPRTPQSTIDRRKEVHMVTVTLLREYPLDPEEESRVIPLDAGRWAMLTGGTEIERRRVANELRVMMHRRAGQPPLAA